MNKHDLLKAIQRDLKLRIFEKNDSATAYIIYSASAAWARKATKSEGDIEQNEGKSRLNVQNVVGSFLENMMICFPECKTWFYVEDDHPESIIVDRMLKGGEIVPVGFDSKLILAPQHVFPLHRRIGLLQGVSSHQTYASGLTRLIRMSDLEGKTASEWKWSVYGQKTAAEITHLYIQNAAWYDFDQRDYEFFDPTCRKSNSNCWVKKLPEKINITLYRHESHLINKDYGFVKREGDQLKGSAISEGLVNMQEVYRFMFGLRAQYQNPVNAYFKQHDKLVELRITSRFPGVEENLLYLLGWPVRNIQDYQRLLFRRATWSFIKHILKQLNVELIEIDSAFGNP